ncbi:EAL domain-containing protein [Dissulfurirhabdus thermomarina]|uniref:EAL domain-containing protein n=1 Tax=Dissulfurirhabdus thermomarina TaxID=1765737 RepID=A0A6N9TSN3_DISTH|nr:EAL domain-containing protein [Dissulfurirhabdus thermomarina]NDY42457.1 EAL domain-containing protein [Dissulfurirhabdus thermomarina]NMX23845.1 EAL domain-containing protein [Dissulfurirhabdus thermomarina]
MNRRRRRLGLAARMTLPALVLVIANTLAVGTYVVHEVKRTGGQRLLAMGLETARAAAREAAGLRETPPDAVVARIAARLAVNDDLLYVALLDARGKTLGRASRSGAPLPPPLPGEISRSGPGGPVHRQLAAPGTGTRYLDIAAPVQGPGETRLGFVQVGVSREGLHRQVRNILLSTAGVTLALLVLGGLVLLHLGRRLAAPLQALMDATREAAEGRFDRSVAVTGDDEVGELAKAFTSMQARLRKTFSELTASQRRLRKAQRMARMGDWTWIPENGVVTCSENLARMLGLPPGDAVLPYAAFLEAVAPEDRERVAGILAAVARDGTPQAVEHRLKGPDGRSFHVLNTVEPTGGGDGLPPGVMGTVQDISDRKAAERKIRHLAYHDNLTGLANRALFMEILETSVAQAKRKEALLAVLFVDIDNFKRINDSLGPEIGDRLLAEAGRRLNACVRTTDRIARPEAEEDPEPSAARLAGDEFTILLVDLASPQSAAIVARRIQEALAPPFQVEGHEVYLTASIGISVFPFDGQDAATLLKNADTAMYAAKDQGKNTYQYYTTSMTADAFRRLSLENSLRRALERGEFLLYYQPQVELETERIVGGEALVRWRHPDMGLVSPAEFIPLAEETGLIVPLGAWVLAEAARQAKAWIDAGLPPIRVAVNLSSRQFRERDLRKTVLGALEAAGLESRWLEIEITESILMERGEAAVALLREFREAGIDVAIDDFGTGYSSLGYLKHFPVTSLKIDRSFVQDIPADADDAAITAAIIAMAHQLHLKVVAEGVEDAAQLDFLRRQGCDAVQGYYFSPPVPADEFAGLLAREAA